MTGEASSDRIRMTAEEARRLGEAAMRGAGHDPEEARILADHVLEAGARLPHARPPPAGGHDDRSQDPRRAGTSRRGAA